MQFDQRYNRAEFLRFLEDEFLPEDEFLQEESHIELDNSKYKYTKAVTKLGGCEPLDLVVYEIKHSGKDDPRVGLSKEAFRILANEWKNRALVIFVPEDSNVNYRFSLIEIKLEERADSGKLIKTYSNPRRYSYFLGEGVGGYTPNKYLVGQDRVKDKEDLEKRFSVEVLTKAFYGELSDWYAWAVKVIRFPNNINDPTDDDKFNNECAIRLITRLLFVWFLKQKGLVPDEFFDERYIREKLIEGFNPHVQADIFGKSSESKYYKAILQNLFFAMLNSPITSEDKTSVSERRFRKEGSGYDNNKLMRYEKLFIDPQLFVDIANSKVPFLNGGLFDCLDDKDNGMYIDGFSDKKIVNKSLIVPDYLFFGDEVGKNIDLSDFYGDTKKKKVSARGIIDILKRYNFTIEENTPYDQEVSLDPELLGKVFENLLASYNPETKTTARKQTGSFYTPREIVQYMVDESLVAHLKHKCSEELEEEYRKLMQCTDDQPNLTDEQKEKIILSLFNCKILDPACGSGAFPVGMLQQMVHILTQLDPDNSKWKEILMQNAIDETSEAYRNSSNEDRKENIADIERSFNEQYNAPDYARKLYLIENAIFGVDIQPTAVQISKLRFFISLVVDQKPNDNAKDNFGIRPLPNLEAKFVAANTLIGIDKQNPSLFYTPEIESKENELRNAKHKIFGAKTYKTKRKYKEAVKTLRVEMAQILHNLGAIGKDEAVKLAEWDMFDQNNSSPFFDPEWMFGVRDGFDIVIGNPPYGVSIKGDYRKLVEKFFGKVPDYEIYYYFIQIAHKALADHGVLSYIIPNTYLFNTFADKYRIALLEKWNLIEILDCSKFPIFESATVLNTINIWQKYESTTIGFRNTTGVTNFRELTSKPKSSISKEDLLLMNQNWGLTFCLDSKKISLIQKIKKSRKSISLKYDVSQGYIPYRKSDLIQRYGKDEGTDIVDNRKWHSSIKENNEYLQEIFGRDINKFSYRKTNSYVWYGKHLACYVDMSFFNSRRILVREITNPSIIACIIDEIMVNDPQLLSIIPKNEESLLILWAILNSKLATFFHFNHAPKATKGAFPKILVKDIKEFPIPIISDTEKELLEQLVNDVFKKHKDGNDTSSIEAEIDLLVYKLYELTYDEVKIVDPNTTITKEQYKLK